MLISESRHSVQSNLLSFLFGLCITMRLFVFVGTMSVADVISLLCAPFIVFKQFWRIKREGFCCYLIMCIFLIIALIISSYLNGERLGDFYKYVVSYGGLIAYFLVFYSLFRDNPKGIGWFFFGYAVSGIITIWVLNTSVLEADAAGLRHFGQKETEDIVADALFWTGKISAFGQLPIIMSYLKTPIAYSVAYPLLFVASAFFLTTSARGQSAGIMVSAVLFAVVRKSRTRMVKLGRHIIVACILALLALLTYKAVYSYLAREGVLGYGAKEKYDNQTLRGTSALSILMNSRVEFFMGLFAVLDHPIKGFGANRVDKNGYMMQYVLKFGVDEDVQRQLYFEEMAARLGGIRRIPTHSHIIGAWASCGIFGLIFYVWYLWLMYIHLRRYIAVIPQWFGYFAITMPLMLFGIFFSPMKLRWDVALLAFCMLYAKGVAQGRISMPLNVELEARRYCVD